MSLHKKSVADVAVSGKKVLLRCDFNVPLQNGVIADETRITAALPTIRHLLSQGAAVILCSHLGRPKGQVDPKYSLRPVAARLSELLNQPVELAQDVTGQSARALAAFHNKNTTPAFAVSWRRWLTSTSTTPLARLTAPTLRLRASLLICPQCQGF